MNLEFGSEDRFVSFIRSMNEDDRVALISHTDLDGLVAAKIVQTVLNPLVVTFVNYEELAQPLVDELREQHITRVIFTDLYIGNEFFLKELESFAQVLILDHHLAQKDWNSSRTTFLKVENGYCAGFMCYSLFSKLTNLQIFEWLVACSCISDYCHVKPSDWLSKVYAKHGDLFEQVGTYVRKTGPLWDMQETLSLAIIYFKERTSGLNHILNSLGAEYGSIGDLARHAEEVKGEVERLVGLFDREKQTFSGGYLFECDPRFQCSSMVSSILSGRDIHSIIITLRPDAHLPIYHMSARRQDKQQDMAAFLKKLLEGLEESDGGGHVPAAGGHFLKKDLHEFKRRLGVKP